MHVIRKFEEAVRNLYMQNRIRGSFHPCVGQEATAVGACMALHGDDYLSCTYRGHGHAIYTQNKEGTKTVSDCIFTGGYGYTRELPGADYDPAYVKPHNMWGCSNAQIFSEVSPQMHWNFAVKHDLRWLARWKLAYYGCCEPLDQKIEILKRIPNLRKVSISPRCNTDRAVAKLGPNYVLSRKPNPAILAEDRWHPERARQDLREFLSGRPGGRPVGVGHSIGAIVTLRAALRDPGKFKALVLIDPVLFVPSFLLQWNIIRGLGLGNKVHPLIPGTRKRRRTLAWPA